MIQRVFAPLLAEMLQEFPVVALTGPRQVGKSTLVRTATIGHDRRYVNLDDIGDRGFAEHDPAGLVATPGPLTIDEVQLVPALLRAIKVEVDRDRKPGRYLITGSADLNYAVGLSEVLAGRVGVVSLPPITQLERRGVGERPLWARLILEGDQFLEGGRIEPFDWSSLLVGGFPLSILAEGEASRVRRFDAFRTTYLERDVRRLSNIAHLTEFARLMELSAARTSGLLNQAELGRDAGLQAVTVGRYLSLLEAAQLVRLLRPWFTNIGKRLVKSPKIHWNDSGIAAFLTGLREEDLPAHPLTGRLFESLVVTEVSSLLPVFLPGAQAYHLRSHDGLEIDLLVRYRGALYPFEVKASRTVTPDDARPIERWRELSGSSTTGAVIYAGSEVKRLGRSVVALPLTATDR